MKKGFVVVIALVLILLPACGKRVSDEEIIRSAKSFLMGDRNYWGELWVPEGSQWLSEEVYWRSGDYYFVYFIVESDGIIKGHTHRRGWMVGGKLGEEDKHTFPVSVPPTDEEIADFREHLMHYGWPDTSN